MATPDVTCRITFTGTTYRGNANVTVSGLSCQRWASQLPHRHSNFMASEFPDATMDEVSNFCRNPDGDPTVWCYTMSPFVRWDFCAVPTCHSKAIHTYSESKVLATHMAPTWGRQVPGGPRVGRVNIAILVHKKIKRSNTMLVSRHIVSLITEQCIIWAI